MAPAHALFMSAILAISTLASAEDGKNHGYNVLTCEVSVLSLEEGHSLIVWKGKGVTLGDAHKPFHMSRLECITITDAMADKSFKSSGYCNHTDNDGDKWIDRSWQDSTMQKARYETTGVSGKYKGGREEGSFVYTDLSRGPDCLGVSTWEADR